MWPFILFLNFISSPQTGDLIFLDLDCGPTCEAIESVTKEQFDHEVYSFSHLGLVDREGDEIYIIDAWPSSGVRRILLKDFLKSTAARPSKAWWAQVLKPHRASAQKAVKAAKSFLGVDYDSEFEMGIDKFYCSELVLFAWPELFRSSPMYFGKPQSDDWKVWENYFSEKNRPVPSGLAGISPLGVYLQAKAAGVIKLTPLVD